jgi:hypothetical protein
LFVQFFESKLFGEDLMKRIIDPFYDSSNHCAAGAQVFGLPHWKRRGRPWHAIFESGIKQIYHQVASRKEAPMGAPQSLALLIRKRQMMKRAERNKSQSKVFAEFKPVMSIWYKRMTCPAKVSQPVAENFG